jgi:hypothetical protein
MRTHSTHSNKADAAHHTAAYTHSTHSPTHHTAADTHSTHSATHSTHSGSIAGRRSQQADTGTASHTSRKVTRRASNAGGHEPEVPAAGIISWPPAAPGSGG